jgi:hypothetical protein
MVAPVSRGAVGVAAFLVGLALGLAVVFGVLLLWDEPEPATDPAPTRSPSSEPEIRGTFELSGEVTAASTTSPESPAPRAAGGATGQSGSFDIIVRELSNTLLECDVDRDEAAVVFFDADTVFEPAEIIEGPDYPDNFIGLTVSVEGRIESLPDDVCRLVASRIVHPEEDEEAVSPSPTPTGE